MKMADKIRNFVAKVTSKKCTPIITIDAQINSESTFKMLN